MRVVKKYLACMDLDEMNNMFVGMLNEEEIKTFNAACEAGVAMRVWKGAAGFLGLAQVYLLNEREQEMMKLHRECRR